MQKWARRFEVARVDSDNGLAPFVPHLELRRNTNVLILLRPDLTEVGRLEKPTTIAEVDGWLGKIGERIPSRREGDPDRSALRPRVTIGGKAGTLPGERVPGVVRAISAAWGTGVALPLTRTRKDPDPPKSTPELDRLMEGPHLRVTAPGGISMATRFGPVIAVEVVIEIPTDGGIPRGVAVDPDGGVRSLAPLDPERARLLRERAVTTPDTRSAEL